VKHLHLLLAALLVLLFVPSVKAGENCAMSGGKCRDACGKDEAPETGVFDDCGEKQDCCVARTDDQVRCCIFSFDPKAFGALNCSAPVQGICKKGSASPAPCEKVSFCK
jgi:hypothetical protein